MTKLLWIAVPPLLLAACSEGQAPMANGANDQAMGNMADNAMMAPSNAGANAAMGAATVDTPGYLAKAGAGDMFEIESSKAIMAKTGNAGIKEFAQMMIDQHTQSTEKVKAAAQAAQLTVPAPTLEPMQQQALDRIKSATGTEADRAYLDAQRTAHDQALALHQGYATGGDTAQLKTAAGEIAAVVQRHIGELAKLSAQ